MTDLQLYHFNYVLNQLSKRILPIYFYNHNKAKMCEWQNQICLQSHVIAAYYIKKHFPKYFIWLCEGIFVDNVMKVQYNHSWLWIEDTEKHNDNTYLCDIARVSAHIGLIKSKYNRPDEYILDKELFHLRRQHSWRDLMNDKEYYTGKTGQEIIKDIDQMLIDAKLSFTQYK